MDEMKLELPKIEPFEIIKAGDPRVREKILELERFLKSLPDELKIEIQANHYHSHKVYGRQLVLPAGSLVIGKIHKNETLNIICSGEVTVLTEDGVNHYEGPTVFVSKKGAKRCVYSHRDTYWVTAHGTESTSLEDIENEVIAPTYDDVPSIAGRIALTLEEK